jgi:hypothetical protein
MAHSTGSAAIALGGGAQIRGDEVRGRRVRLLKAEVFTARAATFEALRAFRRAARGPDPQQLAHAANAVSLAAGRLSGLAHMLAASTRKP